MKKLFPIVAFATLLALLVGSLAHTPRNFSEKENRSLQTTVACKPRDLRSGRTMETAEAYLSDQLPFRDDFVAAYMRAGVRLGKVLSRDVYLGQDGRLMQRFTAPDETMRQEIYQTLTNFRTRHSQVPMTLMVATTAFAVYPESLPVDAYGSLESAFAEELQDNLTDYDHLLLLPLMDTQRKEAYYFKTDHHWTADGAFIAASAYVSQRGFTPWSLDAFTARESARPFYGSLMARSGFYHVLGDQFRYYEPPMLDELVVQNAEGDKVPLFYRDMLDTRDQYALFLGGNDAKVTIVNPTVSQGSLVVIKDSYANAVVPFLTPYYHEITVLDPRYCRGGVDQYLPEKPDEILFLMNAISFAEGQWIKNVM